MKKKSKNRDDFYSFYSDSGEKWFPKPKRSRAPFVAFLIFAALLSASAWYGYGFFSKQKAATPDPLELAVSAPPDAKTGSVVEYSVHYKNTSALTFPSAELFAEYPREFIITQTAPDATNEKKNFWNLGSLAPGANGDIHIKGIYQTSAQGDRKLSVSLQYEHPLYHSSFVVKRESSITLSTGSTGHLRIEGPNSLRIGEQFMYALHYTDLADLGNLDAISLHIQMPQGFTLAEQKPAPNDSNDWTAGSLQSALDPGTHEGTITLKGSAEKPAPGEQHVHVQLVQKKANADSITLSEQDMIVNILGGDLALTVTSQNQNLPKSVQAGAQVPLTITFENNGTTTYKDVTISLTKKGSLGLLSQINSPGAVKSNDAISWDGTAIQALDTIKPKDKGEISFVLPIEDKTALSSMQFASADLAASFIVSGKSKKQEDPDGTVIDTPSDIAGPTISLPLISDAHFDAFTKKIPALDGSPTGVNNIRVYWSLENTLHEINTIRMEAVLPKGVQWIGDHARTAGDISYTSSTRTVAWTLNKLPSSVHRIDGSFDLKVIQAPKDNVVVRDARLSAQDSVVSDTIAQTIPVLTAP